LFFVAGYQRSLRWTRAFKDRELCVGALVVAAMFGDDEGDVVVLFVGAEALDFLNDGSESTF